MGVLIDGIWTDGELPQETGERGEFNRSDSRFRDRITADGSSGFKAESGRYHLYVAHGCPWVVKPRYYVINYYSIAKINPSGIIPKGTPVELRTPHDRARLAA
jgi:glutathionyl-hydroquinone reductase